MNQYVNDESIKHIQENPTGRHLQLQKQVSGSDNDSRSTQIIKRVNYELLNPHNKYETYEYLVLL